MAQREVEEAKTRLREATEEAQIKEPEMIARHGLERTGALPIADFRALMVHRPELKEYLLGGPKVDEFEIDPDSDTDRKIAL